MASATRGEVRRPPPRGGAAIAAGLANMKMAKVVSQSIHAKVANGMALDVPSSPPKKMNKIKGKINTKLLMQAKSPHDQKKRGRYC